MCRKQTILNELISQRKKEGGRGGGQEVRIARTCFLAINLNTSHFTRLSFAKYHCVHFLTKRRIRRVKNYEDPTCQLSQLLTSHFNIIIIIPVPKEDLNKSFIKSVTGVFGSPSLKVTSPILNFLQKKQSNAINYFGTYYRWIYPLWCPLITIEISLLYKCFLLPTKPILGILLLMNITSRRNINQNIYKWNISRKVKCLFYHH